MYRNFYIVYNAQMRYSAPSQHHADEDTISYPLFVHAIWKDTYGWVPYDLYCIRTNRGLDLNDNDKNKKKIPILFINEMGNFQSQIYDIYTTIQPSNKKN